MAICEPGYVSTVKRMEKLRIRKSLFELLNVSARLGLLEIVFNMILA